MTETARMYGGSLYDLAAEEGLETRILGELDEAVALFKASPEYLHLLSTPSIPKKAVSYTHLDVYKRQPWRTACCSAAFASRRVLWSETVS